jgi:tyrosine-protein phosphatase YwqE
MRRLRTDFHTHIAPGVDDGSRSVWETVAMARGIAALGVERIHVTPHQFRFGNQNGLPELVRLAARVSDLLARAGLQVEVVAGAEYFFGECFAHALRAGEELATCACDGERLVLIELPLDRPVAGVRRVADTLLRRGIRPVMAHPERHASEGVDPERLHRWRGAGWAFQLNLLSLVGFHGERAEALARELVHDGFYEFVGSDLHRPSELEALREAHATYRALVTTEVVS